MPDDLGLEASGFIRERIAPAADMEVRADGRTLYGLAVPYDQVATVNDGRGDYREMFRYGAFAQTISGGAGLRVKLMANHDAKRFPVGRATMLREDRAGLVGEFHVSTTRDGDEVLHLANDKVLDAFSVGFTPIKQTRNRDGVVERQEVALREVSVVAFPAYTGALIAGVRADNAQAFQNLIDLLRDDPDALTDEQRAEIRTFLDTSSRQMEAAEAAATGIETPSSTEAAATGTAEATTAPQSHAGPSHELRQRRIRALAVALKGPNTP